jgi:hypothetical protein
MFSLYVFLNAAVSVFCWDVVFLIVRTNKIQKRPHFKKRYEGNANDVSKRTKFD